MKLRIRGFCYLYPIPYRGVEVLGRCVKGRDYCAVSRVAEDKIECYYIKAFRGYKTIVKGSPERVGIYEVECDSYSVITPAELQEIVQAKFYYSPFL